MRTPSIATTLRALMTLALILTPVSLPSESAGKRGKSGDQVSLADIMSSFSARAFAETSSYGTCFDSSFKSIPPITYSDPQGGDLCDQSVEIQEYCAPEQTSTSVTAYHIYSDAYGSPAGEVVSASVAQDTTALASPVPSFTPNNVTFNEIYDSSNKNETQTFGFTTPTVASATVLPIDISGIFHDADNPTLTYTDVIRSNFQVDPAPSVGPSVTSSSPTTASVPFGGNTDFPVSFTVTDPQSSHTNLTLELSSDNFTTIAQSQTFSNVATGSTLSHTFTALPVGTYSWRVVATETDPNTACGTLATPPPFTFNVVDPITDLPVTVTSSSYTDPGTMHCADTACTFTPADPTDTNTYHLSINNNQLYYDIVLNPLGVPGPITLPELSGNGRFPLTITALASEPTPTPAATQTATVTGHLFYDKNANAKQDAGEPNLSDVHVTLTDNGAAQQVVTDTAGNFTAQVALGTVTAQVSATDPNLPKGYHVTTGANVEKVTVTTLADIPFPSVGYATIASLPNAGSDQVPNAIIALLAALTGAYVTVSGRTKRRLRYQATDKN